MLLTALPASLRQIAATNIPAVSSILWREFLDDNKPEWFKDLPPNIQSYLVVQYGPSTAWPTSAPTASSSIASTTADSSTTSLAAITSPTSGPESPSESTSGLSQGAKIGIGIGVPLGVIALLAVIVPFCIACRKKKPKKSSGYEPPPSPGFMPHGAFQEKSTSYQEYRRPLNREQSWDQDDDSWTQPIAANRPQQNAHNMPMGNAATVVGPALVHTHSSNRARGKRTSHNSLHAVAEVTEPDEERAAYNPSQRRSSMPERLQDLPPVPVGSSIRRKPLSTAEPHPQLESPVSSPIAERGSYGHFSLLRPAILQQDHSNSSSSGGAATFSSPADSRRSSDHTAPTDPSPTSSPPPSHHNRVDSFAPVNKEGDAAQHPNQYRVSNPFTNAHEYVEDYGPEYQNGYVDVHDGLYGGHRSLDAYPVVPEKSERRSSKGPLGGMTEWPLRDWPLKSLGTMGRGRRERSPQWDRVYEP